MSGFDQRVEMLFEATVALRTEAERAQYLSRECPDPKLRSEIESLVACHQDPDPVFTQETPARVEAETVCSSPSDRFIGQTLDEKYRLDRFQGQGGMGSVYLSTHLGTGRYVAVKLIAPEYMRNQEFFRRFKREAQAAGRLRHPNIVDVTDFGVARVGNEKVAYLVMEYLDGCSLSEVLAEEKRLPLRWVVEILEQVCSAVHEAHQQGIIHRDLKPANIWLEPNTLGGYRVKVLDFGIAKLAEASDALPSTKVRPTPPTVTSDISSLETVAEPESSTTATTCGPTGTNVISPETALHGASESLGDGLVAPGDGLTRAGALLGTPAYMSPEQCGGQALDARADVYSLGVIAYQMLAGSLPFTGGTAFLLQAHQTAAPPFLADRCKNVPKTVAQLIMSALEKHPESRPQTANAFAQALRANAEELGALYRRAFALYSEYFPQVMKLSLLAHIPVLIVTAVGIIVTMRGPQSGSNLFVLELVVGLATGAATFVTGSTIAGMIALIVTGLAAVPLKPVTLRATFDTLRRRFRPLLKTGLLATMRILLGVALLVVPGLILLVRYSLWAPVVLLEDLQNKAALRRSRDLAARSWRTCILATAFQVLLPGLVQWLISRLISPDPGHNDSVRARVIAQITGLSSILVTPLVSIVLALVYLKMRQLGGELLSQVRPRVETTSNSLWEQRIRTRLSGRTRNT